MTSLLARVNQKAELRCIEAVIAYYEEEVAHLLDKRSFYVEAGLFVLDPSYYTLLLIDVRRVRKSLAYYEQERTHALNQIVYYT